LVYVATAFVRTVFTNDVGSGKGVFEIGGGVHLAFDEL
jgi:hypothetical protein